MSHLEAYRGIFIQSKESNEEFIKACIRELQPVCNSSIKRVVPYTGKGIQMYFENERTVVTVLRRRVLLVSGKRCEMCPLVTHLTIHKVIPTDEHDIQKKLSDKLQRYVGPVLKLNELPILKDFPSIGSGNWRVIIDIPELEALKMFQNLKKKKVFKNSSNETSIEFFYAEDGMKLSFFCRKCEKDGHISQRCKMLFKRKIKPNAGKNICSDTCFQKDAVASTSTVSSNTIREQTFREATGQPKRKALNTSEGKPSVDDYCWKLLLLKSKVLQDTLTAPSLSQPVTTPPTKNILSSLTVKSESQSEDVQNTLRDPSCSQRVTTAPARSIHSSVNIKSKSHSKVVRNTLNAPSCSHPATTPPAKNILSSVTVKSEPQSKVLQDTITAPSLSQPVTTPPTKNILSSVTVKSESHSKVVPDTLRAPSFSHPVTTPPIKNILPSVTVKNESQSKDAENTFRAPSFSQRLATPPARNIHSSVNVKRLKDVQNTLRAPALSERETIPPTRNIHSSVTVKTEPQSEGVQNTLSAAPSCRHPVTTPPTKNILSSVTVKHEPQSEDAQNTSGAPSFSQPVITSPTRNIHSSVTVKSESRNPRRNSVTAEIKILPNSRTEECIQKAGGACRLSQPQLENFFNHVKGKRNILRILKIYKEMHKISEKALREQLSEIVRLYHVSKLPETKEDKTLIRWLEYLVERLKKGHREFKKKQPEKSLKSLKEKPKCSTVTSTYTHT